MVRFLIQQAPKKLKQVRANKTEWGYMEAINDFLDQGGEKKGFKVEIFLKSDKDEMYDTGNLFLYEQTLLRMLLKHSKYQKQNKQLAKELLSNPKQTAR